MKSTIFITKIFFCMLLFMPVISAYGNVYEEKPILYLMISLKI